MSTTLEPAPSIERFNLEVGFRTDGWFWRSAEQGFVCSWVETDSPAPRLRVDFTEAVIDLARQMYERGVADGANTVVLSPASVDALAAAFANMPAPTVQNTVNVPDVNVNLSQEPVDTEITFKRKNGQIESAKLTETQA